MTEVRELRVGLGTDPDLRTLTIFGAGGTLIGGTLGGSRGHAPRSPRRGRRGARTATLPLY